MAAAAAADTSKPYIPDDNCLGDGRWSKEGEATATCFCGTVQLVFVSLTAEPVRFRPGELPGSPHVTSKRPQ